MASPGQVKAISDLLVELRWGRAELRAEEERWGDYEELPPTEVPELIDWLIEARNGMTGGVEG